MESTNRFAAIMAEYGFSLTKEQENAFEIYKDMLLSWNERMNLTAITEAGEVEVKHFLDSLLLLSAVEIPPSASLIDVGTGAGFPGVPVKIMRPALSLTLLDSLNKRMSFLTALSQALGQENRMIHGRAEEYGRRPELREEFDFATARAVAALPALCEYCLPFVRVGGVFAALKGPDMGHEAASSSKAIGILGGSLREIKEFSLPGGHLRSIVLIEKISQTPAKYPRAAVKITKTPL